MALYVEYVCDISKFVYPSMKKSGSQFVISAFRGCVNFKHVIQYSVCSNAFYDDNA